MFGSSSGAAALPASTPVSGEAELGFNRSLSTVCVGAVVLIITGVLEPCGSGLEGSWVCCGAPEGATSGLSSSPVLGETKRNQLPTTSKMITSPNPRAVAPPPSVTACRSSVTARCGSSMAGVSLVWTLISKEPSSFCSLTTST